MRHTLAAIILVLSCPVLARSADFSAKAKGTSSAQLLKLPAGARAIAMGEAYTALAHDSLSVYWNPAGLAGMSKRHSANFMHAFYLADINFGYATYATRLGNAGGLGASIQYLDAGTISRTDATGASLGSYSPRDMVYGLAWGGKILGLPLGVGGKYISSKILNSASTYAMDAGVKLPWKFFEQRLGFAAAAKNMGPGLKFHQERDPLPYELRLGGYFGLTSRAAGGPPPVEDLLLSADVSFGRDNDPIGAFGVEQTKLVGDILIAGRAGVNTRTVNAIPGFSGFSFGLGVAVKSISFDYAIAPMGHLGMTHRISLGWSF